MRTKTTIALLLLALSLSLSAQDVRPADLPKQIEVGPVLMPTTSTNVATATVWVYQVTLTNNTLSDVLCTIKDRQSTALPLIATNTTIAAGQHWILTYPSGRKMPSGITWSCGTGSAVTGHIYGRQQ